MKRKFYFLFIIAIFTLFFHSCNFSSEEFIFDENAYNIAFSNWKKLNLKDYLFDFYYEGDINKIIFHVKVENGLGSITGTSKFVEYEEDEVKKVLLQEQIDEIVSKNSIKSMTELFISQYEQMKKTIHGFVRVQRHSLQAKQRRPLGLSKFVCFLSFSCCLVRESILIQFAAVQLLFLPFLGLSWQLFLQHGKVHGERCREH